MVKVRVIILDSLAISVVVPLVVTLHTVKPVLSAHSKRTPKLVFNTNYRLMQVISLTGMLQGEHSAILSTFIKLPFSIKTFV